MGQASLAGCMLRHANAYSNMRRMLNASGLAVAKPWTPFSVSCQLSWLHAATCKRMWLMSLLLPIWIMSSCLGQATLSLGVLSMHSIASEISEPAGVMVWTTTPCSHGCALGDCLPSATPGLLCCAALSVATLLTLKYALCARSHFSIAITLCF